MGLRPSHGPSHPDKGCLPDPRLLNSTDLLHNRYRDCRVGFEEMRECHRLVIQPAPNADDLRHEVDTASFRHDRGSDLLAMLLVQFLQHFGIVVPELCVSALPHNAALEEGLQVSHRFRSINCHVLKKRFRH